MSSTSVAGLNYYHYFHIMHFNIQGDLGGKVNILGGHNICHSKQESIRVYVHVPYSERFPNREISLCSS
jgi:hypothetical protein